MKRIITVIAACIIITSLFASCNDPLSSSNQSKAKSSSSASSSKKSKSKTSKPKVKKTYADSFDDLEAYMKDKGYLTGDMIKNANNTKLPKVKGVNESYGYELIGAKYGKKYVNNNVVIELYEFKPGAKNDTIESVKKEGIFTLYDMAVAAYLTDDDKYMLVYNDKSLKEDDVDSDAYKTMQKAIKDFKAFKPESKETTEETKADKTTKSSKTSSKKK